MQTKIIGTHCVHEVVCSVFKWRGSFRGQMAAFVECITCRLYGKIKYPMSDNLRKVLFQKVILVNDSQEIKGARNQAIKNFQKRRKLVREVWKYEKSRVKAKCLTEEREQRLLWVIGSQFRKIEGSRKRDSTGDVRLTVFYSRGGRPLSWTSQIKGI